MFTSPSSVNKHSVEDAVLYILKDIYAHLEYPNTSTDLMIFASHSF